MTINTLFEDSINEIKSVEKQLDSSISNELYIVARLDGRNFSKFTQQFNKPFDYDFFRLMNNTTRRMFSVGFPVQFAYHQSDEISLLFKYGDSTFNRRVLKYASVLSAEASAYMSVMVSEFDRSMSYFKSQNDMYATFDCRLLALPRNRVVDYFKWRRADAKRNAINAYAYWTLVNKGRSKRQVAGQLRNKNTTELLDIIEKQGIVWSDVEEWQRYGVMLYWQNYEIDAYNPKTDEKVVAQRRRVITSYDTDNIEKFESAIYNRLD